MKLPILPAVLLVAAGLATACGGSSNSSSSTTASTPASNSGGAYGKAPAQSTSTPAAAGAISIKAAKGGDLGTLLTDSQGRVMYLFEADKSDKSTCSGACAQAWPPVTTDGAPQAGSGIKASLLGTTKRSDGSTEATYNGHPLYYFTGDQKPGQAAGEGSKAFGAEWYVVGPNGKKIDEDDH
jgi:predicted lipoprotein with Yx(FWY)xxD motif